MSGPRMRSRTRMGGARGHGGVPGYSEFSWWIAAVVAVAGYHRGLQGRGAGWRVGRRRRQKVPGSARPRRR